MTNQGPVVLIVARDIESCQTIRRILAFDKTFKKAPLSPVGYTSENRYTLQAPFGPIGKLSSSARARRRPAS